MKCSDGIISQAEGFESYILNLTHVRVLCIKETWNRVLLARIVYQETERQNY